MSTLDPRDVFYLIAGGACLGLTFLPLICSNRVLNVPTIYVALGALLALLPLPIGFLNPLAGELQLKVIEHAAELIVIVSLAGAGLAIDRRAGLRRWGEAWMLIAVAMPLTIGALALLGTSFLGLGIAEAVLLGAALAPTDPVLARSVQVSGPTEGEEHDVRLALTAEAGVNDGLAFPFIYLALALAGAGAAKGAGADWFELWLGRDVFYRILIALALGWMAGHVLARFVFSRFGDASNEAHNAGLVMVGSTFFIYGMTEAVDGYGFLAVFVGAYAARNYKRGTEEDLYVVHPHRFSDQIEKILLGLLLLWLGYFAASGVLANLTWREAGVALALIVVIRPVAGWLALLPTDNPRHERGIVAVLGIRGLGTVFYIAYAQSHGDFAQIETVWRVAVVAMLGSILLHGIYAPFAMSKLGEEP